MGDSKHRSGRIEPRIDSIHAAIRDVLKIGAEGAKPVGARAIAKAQICQPVQIEVLALRPGDLVTFAIHPAKAAAAREKDDELAGRIPPFQFARRGRAEKGALWSPDDRLHEQTETGAERERTSSPR